MSKSKKYKSSSVARYEILRVAKGRSGEVALDSLVVEEPLEIRVDTHPISVTMRTPGSDKELAAGFLLSEGVIRTAADIAKIAPNPRSKEQNIVDVFLRPSLQLDLARLKRNIFVSSSCGLCGKASIENVNYHFPPVSSDLRISAKIIVELPERLRAAQATFSQTGGLHAAAIFSNMGRLVLVDEDVGRHNAVDKVLGFALLNDMLPLNESILVVSGRASFEIVQKGLSAAIPIIVAVSAPSSLAVELAEKSGQTLIGFVREGRMNVYCGRERVVFSSKVIHGGVQDGR